MFTIGGNSPPARSTPAPAGAGDPADAGTPVPSAVLRPARLRCRCGTGHFLSTAVKFSVYGDFPAARSALLHSDFRRTGTCEADGIAGTGYGDATMPFKTCRHCGKRNPRMLTHCLFCGEPLLEKRQSAGKVLAFLQLVILIGICILVLVYVVVPAVWISFDFGQDFIRSVSEQSAAASIPSPEYRFNQPAESGGLQVMVSSAEDGEYTFQSSKFFTVYAGLKNLRAAGNIRVTGGNFVLIDAEGTQYFPYGVGSQVVYDIRPGESGLVQLTYIIPRDAAGARIRFTFPVPADGTGNPGVVLFVL